MVNTFNNILNKISKNEALISSEIEYLNLLIIKYPYFKLCKNILFENCSKIEIHKNTENAANESTEYKDFTTPNNSIISQFEQKEIILKFINNPFNFYDFLK